MFSASDRLSATSRTDWWVCRCYRGWNLGKQYKTDISPTEWLFRQVIVYAKPIFKCFADLEPRIIGKDPMQGRRRLKLISAARNWVHGCISSQTLLHKVSLSTTVSPCSSKHREINVSNEKEKLLVKKYGSIVKSLDIHLLFRGLCLHLDLAQRIGRRLWTAMLGWESGLGESLCSLEGLPEGRNQRFASLLNWQAQTSGCRGLFWQFAYSPRAAPNLYRYLHKCCQLWFLGVWCWLFVSFVLFAFVWFWGFVVLFWF